MDGFSIILPAHNEARVIERTLATLMACRLDRDLQVIVVANGCTDDTAARARAVGGPVEVIETPIGNKIHALNLGDRAARYFPRAFMDADVELSGNVLQGLLNCFADPKCLLAAPAVRYIYPGWNPLLAGYYALWKSLPYVRRSTTGRGCYAIDQRLRERFEQFPSITGDDKFIHNLCSPAERRIANLGSTVVYLPSRIRELLRVKTRWTYGNLELAARHAELNRNDRNQHDGALRFLLPRPWLWPNVPMFLFVYWYAHRAARRQLQAGGAVWGRADSSRSAEGRSDAVGSER